MDVFCPWNPEYPKINKYPDPYLPGRQNNNQFIFNYLILIKQISIATGMVWNSLKKNKKSNQFKLFENT